MASTKEQFLSEAVSSFKTEVVNVGKATGVMRELSHEERKTLDALNYKVKTDGELETDKDGFLVPLDIKFYYERWISACLEPKFTVEEIASWPTSLKKDLCDKARKVNNIDTSQTIAKN